MQLSVFPLRRWWIFFDPSLQKLLQDSRDGRALQGRFGLDAPMQLLWQPDRGLVFAHSNRYVWYSI